MKLKKQILIALESDLPLVPQPFQMLAGKAGLTESELLEGIAENLQSGVIRRYGARIKHQAVGLHANVMVVWQVDGEAVEQIAVQMCTEPAVSHCYERPCFRGFPFNLYTMIHGRSREECEAVITRLSTATGVTNYRALWTVKEFKKSTPCYHELLHYDLTGTEREDS
jgi:siroheme decarboxylase